MKMTADQPTVSAQREATAVSQTRRLRVGRLPIGLVAAAALLALSASSVSARHIGATLDCGEAGVFTTSGTDALPSGFQAPQGTVYLLEGTNQQFVVFQRAIVGGPVIDVAPGMVANQGESLVACEFTFSDGTAVYAFLYGMFTPQS
jgi:hypothetical protein